MQHALTSRSPTPDNLMPAPVESPFCDRCERNQSLVSRCLAEYLPEEDDPEYAEKEKKYPEYQAWIEDQFPLVCENCITRVQGRIRQAGYAAKAEAVGRKLEQSKKYQDKTLTPRQLSTLLIILLAKYAYITSLLATLLWHAFGALANFDSRDHGFDPKLCLSDMFFAGQVHKSCAISSFAQTCVSYALLGDLLTIWWNPKLAYKTTHANQRMSGVVTQWMIRGLMMLLNVAMALISPDDSVREDGVLVAARVDFFHYTHIALFVLQLLSTWISWTTVTIRYVSTKELLRPLDAHLPRIPMSTDTTPRASPKKTHSNQTGFDTMASAFSSTFNAEPANYEPPSPTLTVVSTTTTETNDLTPWSRRQSSIMGEEMDWTPTKPRFDENPPALIHPIHPRKLTLRSSTSGPSPNFTPTVPAFKTGPDANPFRRRVPAAPKAPAAKIVDPWKRQPWQPDPLVREKNLFDEDREKNKILGAGLHGKGVPRTVEREAQLFGPPKFKYEAGAYGGGEKTTGLEDTFNNLFAK